jgi:thymidylate synthase (FAD)
MEDIGMYIPDCIKGSVAQDRFEDVVDHVESAYRDLANNLITDDMPFHKKKEITSALRRIAPGGHSTNIIMTANHRAWRHMIELRTAEGAEEEIRKVFLLVAHHFQVLYPAFYQDMDMDSNGVIVFANGKI